MTAAELKSRLAQGEDIDVVDVREAEEFAVEETVPGARNVPMGRVFMEASKGTLSKGKKIVTVCKGGTRNEIVARELGLKGYEIDHLEGGMGNWKN